MAPFPDPGMKPHGVHESRSRTCATGSSYSQCMQLPDSLFLGHGAPSLALSTHPANAFLRDLGRRLPRPRAVIVVSPHRMAEGFDVGHAERHRIWHDFYGFDPALHELRYDAPGAPEIASAALDGIRRAGLPGIASADARIDHGIWVPLSLIWPEAEVPVVPVASHRRDPRTHLALGRALAPLVEQGCLVIGSGSLTHNLGDLELGDEFAPPQPWAQAFDDWIATRLQAGDLDALCDYRRQAPMAAHAHPSEEHLLPLFVACGAGGRARSLFRGFSHGNLSLSSYAFG